MRPAEFLRRLVAWRRRDALERELSQEMEAHLDMLARDFEQSGMSTEEARAAARRQLGNDLSIRERSRDSWGLPALDAVLQDLRHALRGLARAPAFTVAVVLTLGLGIGATTSIFGVLSGVVLHPLPFPNEGRLITLCEQYPGATKDWCSISPPNVEDIAARSKTIEAIGIGRSWSAHMTTPNGAQDVPIGIATPGLFRALGVGVIKGRMIEAADLVGRPSDVALLTYEMWQDKFAGDSAAVGRTILLDEHPVRIVGILQPGFRLPEFEYIEMWRPVHINPADEQHRDWRGFVAYGRLRAGSSLRDARIELAAITAGLRREHFATTPGWDIVPESLRDLVVGGVRPVLLMFLGAVALVLLIACANVSNLLLARTAVRGREMALRSALGASAGRIVRALLVESLVLALGGTAVGVALAAGAVRVFRALAPGGIPRVAEVGLDARVLVFASGLSVMTALLVGLAPALRASRVDLAQALREGGRSGPARHARFNSMLVTLELAMAVLLVAGAATLARSFAAFTAWNPGFETRHLALFSVSPASARYDTGVKLGALWDRLEGDLNSIPGVTSVGLASAGPNFGGLENWEMELEGRPPDQKVSVRWFDVSPGYFAALGVPLKRGRALDSHDVHGGPSVCLVNETLARRYWPGQDPVGRRIVFPVSATDRLTFTIVGVVGDVAPTRPGAAPEPEMYWSNRQQPRPYTWVVVRTSVDPASIFGMIRSRLKEVDADFDAKLIRTMPELQDRELAAPRFDMLLLLSFGAAALLLAAVGTYGLLAYNVTQHTREIGIRLALGAQPRHVIRSVLSRGLGMSGAGIVLGLGAFLFVGRALAPLAPGVSLKDPLTLAGAGAVLLGVSAAACLVPALRAGRVDPILTLSAE
ncbi:MAG: ADOP family duplicated permease [Gemmatimonadales bacterium]